MIHAKTSIWVFYFFPVSNKPIIAKSIKQHYPTRVIVIYRIYAKFSKVFLEISIRAKTSIQVFYLVWAAFKISFKHTVSKQIFKLALFFTRKSSSLLHFVLWNWFESANQINHLLLILYLLSLLLRQNRFLSFFGFDLFHNLLVHLSFIVLISHNCACDMTWKYTHTHIHALNSNKCLKCFYKYTLT